MSSLSVTTVQTTNLAHNTSPIFISDALYTTSPQTAINIDSAGRFFRRNLPYFVATRNGQADETGGGFMTFGTDSVFANRGNWYNGPSGTATAPSKGLYAFFCKTLTPNDATGIDLRWYINGATSDNYGAGFSGNWSGHKQMTAFATFYLEQNDTVRVFNINSGTRCCNVHNTYMGYLVGG